jgi:CRP/FNR family transcriptional regulator, cyclic AMP receptor protein
MAKMLDLLADFPDRELAVGEVVMNEGERTGRLYVLADGAMEVFRGDVTIAFVDEPGSVFGEMSLLLDIPHTASVRAATPAKVRIIDDALDYLPEHPELLLPIAKLLALRVQNSTTYLVDLKRQFQDRKDHFAIVDEVLESLVHQQDVEFTPADDLPDES